MDLSITIGKNIKLYRDKKGMTQEGLGEAIRHSGKQVSYYEHGKQIPPIDVLLKICQALDCEVGALLGEEEYNEGTKFKTEFTKRTGLSSESFEHLCNIAACNKPEIEGWPGNAERHIIDRMLCSKEFPGLISSLADMLSAINDLHELEKGLQNEIGEAVYKEVERIYHDRSIDYMSDMNLQETLSEEIIIGLSKYEAEMDKYMDIDYRIKVFRYETSTAFEKLLRGLFPELKN